VRKNQLRAREFSLIGFELIELFGFALLSAAAAL